MEYIENKLTRFSAIPIRTIGKTQVVAVTGEDAAKLLNREAELSRSLSSECNIENDRIVFDLNRAE
jgi:hypothetical protein